MIDIKRRKKIAWITSAAAIAALSACLLQKSHKTTGAAETPAPTAAVAAVERQDLFRVVEIPAEFRPFVEVELRAKVSGFLQSINVDFGDRVKTGQLLATLEVPELKDELDSAIAAEKQAEADYKNAHLIYQRLAGVNREHPALVAQQDIDNAEAKDNADAAALAAAKSNIEKFQTLFDYTQITAPFDGVITWRYADPGALIQAGTSSAASKPLLRISDNYHLRLDFPVSVEYVQYIHQGDTVSARVDSLGGKTFTGVISRFSREVNADTRTMTTEIEVPNPNLELTPGMYAYVKLNVQKRPSALAVPVEAVSSGASQPTVFLVNDNNEIQEQAVTLGIETPASFEILAGLKQGDRVLIGGRSEFHPGEKVEPKPVPANATPEP